MTQPGQVAVSYGIPYYIMSYSVYLGKSWLGATAWELAGHQLVGGEQLHCTSLVLYILILVLVLLSLTFLTELFLSSPMNFTAFSPILFPILIVREGLGGGE